VDGEKLKRRVDQFKTLGKISVIEKTATTLWIFGEDTKGP
jgi:hypothetical protein